MYKRQVWCFCSLADNVLSGAYACADFSLRALAGDTSSGNSGQADAFILRLSLIRHTGHVLLDRLEPSPQMWKKHWDASESRTSLTPYDAELKVGMSWRAGVSTISFFAWAEDIALKGDYYLQLRTATRHSKSPVGFMEHDTVAVSYTHLTLPTNREV